MSFWCLHFRPKTNENKSTSKVQCVRLFFGRNVGLKKIFRICLTFSRFNRHKLTFVVGEQKNREMTSRSTSCHQNARNFLLFFAIFASKGHSVNSFFFLWNHPLIMSRQNILVLFLTHLPNVSMSTLQKKI